MGTGGFQGAAFPGDRIVVGQGRPASSNEVPADRAPVNTQPDANRDQFGADAASS